ncbi:MAG: acetyl-CoA carboxylase, carboxyltransferase subunit beta [Candidatus Aminicenantes bacterium]|nr:acetyl-CoA carboxylase, carboxyltransferase subunit beta [Candidatus Aminicenantes bacterium]
MRENLWTRCDSCGKFVYSNDIIDSGYVCPHCGFHFHISAAERLATLFDGGKYDVVDDGIFPLDFLEFVDTQSYAQRLEDHQKETSLPEAVVNAVGMMGGIRVIVSALDFGFMGGSMGSVVGEKVTRAAERALKERIPLIIVSCSGGARMQEGALSLMQMAKVSGAIARLDQAAVPFVSVLADPTSGGVTASFAMQGDINIAEPDAFILFAGDRVVDQTIKEKIPKGFQHAEFIRDHGFLDDVVPRKELRPHIIRALRLFLNRPG